MSTKKSRTERIDALRKEIEAIENEPSDYYELVCLTPDGSGSRDLTDTIAISGDREKLIKYCEETHSYSPSLTWKRPESDKNFMSAWYLIRDTDTIIIN